MNVSVEMQMIAKAKTLPPRRIDLESAGMILAPEEFDAIEEYDNRFRYELIEGVLVVNPIPSEGESAPNELLGGLLFAYKEYHSQGKSLDKTLPERYIRVGNSRRRADRVIWTGLGRTPHFATDVPSIAIEYVSRSRRDRNRAFVLKGGQVLKRDEYLQAGVQEYWLIDRFDQSMTVFRFNVGQIETITLSRTETYSTSLLPGFELPLARILDEADDCSQFD